MPYIPGCRYDIFISYASESNQDAWVTQFVERLGIELEGLLGRSRFSAVRGIYFDRREMRVGQDFPEELRSAAQHSALFIPILSQGYLDSNWCERERIAFQHWLPEGAVLAECLAPIQIRPVHDSLPRELGSDTENIFSFLANPYSPLPAGSGNWSAKLLEFAAQVYEMLKVLRLRYKPVYVGRSPNPFLDLRDRVVGHLEARSFRTTRGSGERSALAVHFLGGSDGDLADQERLEAIEKSVVGGAPSILFQPFGSALSIFEEEWLSGATPGGKSVKSALTWIERKHEQELLDILENELTRMNVPSSAMDAPILACESVDEAKAVSLQSALTEIKCRIREVELRAARTYAERVRLWDSMIREAPALVFCWGDAERAAVFRLEEQAQRREHSGTRCWYVFDPDRDGKLREIPRAFSDPASLARFLRDRRE